MSTHQVGADHIEAMLAAARCYGVFAQPGGGTFSFYHHGKRHCFCRAEDLADFGRVLWEANAASVRSGCPSGAGGHLGSGRSSLLGRPGTRLRFHPGHQRTPSPIETLKLCACYRYQASDSDVWEASEAAAFVDALEHCAIVALPGYDAAPWEWSR